MTEATWLALTAVLTVVGGAWTWYAARHRGPASALRGAGLTLLPPAAYLTDSLETVVEIGSSIADWATGLVLSPTVWVGIVLAGLAVVLLGVSSALRSRALGHAREERQPGETAAERGRPERTDDLDDIEALLRRRGIT